MRQQDGRKAQPDPQNDEQQHKGDTHDNFAVQHGNVGDACKNSPHLFLHGMYADGGQRPDQGGKHTGQQGDHQCGIECLHDLLILEKRPVPGQGKTAPFCP